MKKLLLVILLCLSMLFVSLWVGCQSSSDDDDDGGCCG